LLAEGLHPRIPVWHPNQLQQQRPVRCSRWAKRLQDVARASPRHAAFVRDVIERALHGLPTPPPPDLASLLSLQRELYAETGSHLRDPETRRRLADLPGGGQAAAIARTLLATG
jgi:hypothetical protein